MHSFHYFVFILFPSIRIAPTSAFMALNSLAPSMKIVNWSWAETSITAAINKNPTKPANTCVIFGHLLETNNILCEFVFPNWNDRCSRFHWSVRTEQRWERRHKCTAKHTYVCMSIYICYIWWGIIGWIIS